MTQIDFEKERQRWDQVAEKYDYEINAVDLHLGAEIAARLNAHLGSAGSLLEAGCGSGHLSAALARCGYDVSLMDFSEVALSAARGTFEQNKLSAHWYEANLFQLSQSGIPPADCVWNSGVLEHYTTEVMIQALHEMAAVSRQFVLSIVPNGQSVLYRAFRHWMRRQGRWEWGEENLIESQAPLFEAAGLEVLEESYVGGDFIPYFAQTLTQDAEFADLWTDMLQGGILPANQKYLLLTMGRLASKKRSAARKSAAKPASQLLEEKNWSIARLIESLGDREHELLRLGGELDARTEELEALQGQAAELRQNHELAQQALAQQKESFQQTLAERERDFEQRLTERNREFEQRFAERDREHEQRLAERGQELERRLSEREQEFEHWLHELNKALQSAGAERDRALQGQAAARQALAEHKERHKKELKSLSDQLREAAQQRDQTMAEASAARAQISGHSAEIAGLREQLAMVQHMLESQKALLDKQAEELEQTRREREEALVKEATTRLALEHQQATAEEQSRHLAERLEAAGREQSATLAREAEAREALALARGQLEIKQTELQDLRHALSSNSQELANAQSKLDNLEKAHQELILNHQTLIQDNKELCARQKQLMEEAQERDQLIETLRAEIAAAQNAEMVACEKNAQTEKELARRQWELGAKEELLAQTQDELRKTEELLAEAQEARRQVETESAAKLESLENQHHDLTVQYQAVLEEKEKAQQSLSSFTSRLQRLKNACAPGGADKSNEQKELN